MEDRHESMVADTAADVAGAAEAGTRALDPALLAQLTAFRTQLQASLGEVVLALVGLPRYRYLAV